MLKREGFHKRPRDWQPSDRQRTILDAIADGRTNDEIARIVGISLDGVKWHVSELMARTGQADRRALGRWWRDVSRRRFLPAISLSLLRAGKALAVAATVVVVLVALAGLLPQRDQPGGGAAQTAGLDAGPEGVTGDLVANAGASANAPAPFFMRRQLDYAGFTTVRLSGGAMLHPITVPYVEFHNACNTVLGNGPSCAVNGDASSPEVRTWPKPDGDRTRYHVEFVQIGADRDVPIDPPDLGAGGSEYWYVPGDPSLVGPLPDYGWVALDPPAVALFDRYIALAEAGFIAEDPALQEALAVSVERFGVEVLLSHGHTNAEAPKPALEFGAASARQLVALLGEAEPATLALRGRLIGQRGYDFARLDISFGGGAQTYYYVPPGQIARRGLLLDRRSLDAWGYVGGLAPPGYYATVLSIPEEFDRLMGYSASPLDPSIQSSVISQEPPYYHWRFIDRIEIWREGETRVVLPPLESQPCPQGCVVDGPAQQQPAGELPRQLPTFSGERLRVAIWPTAPSYLAESVQPALYDYYLDDGTGRPVLVETWGPSLLGGRAGAGYFAFYPPPGLDSVLRRAAVALP